LGSPGFSAGKIPPGGGVNAQIAANGAAPSPATQGFVSGLRQLSVGAPTLTKMRPVLSKTNGLSG